MICSTLCRFFMGSTGFTPQNSHSTPSSFWGLDQLTIPAGRQVEILEESGDRLRISVGGLAEGWVAKDAVELLRPKSVTSTLPAENSAASPSAGNSVKKTENEASSVNPSQSVAEKSSVQITVLEDEAEEIDFGDGPCKGQRVQKAFDCRTELGRDAEAKDVELKFYAILINETDGKPYSVNGKMLPPVEIKRLRESSTHSAKDLNTQRFTHSQRELSCRCCRKRLVANLQGYYAELLVDGLVVAKASSPLKKAHREAFENHLGKPLLN